MFEVVTSVLVFILVVLWLLQKDFISRNIDKLLQRIPPGPLSLPLIGARGIDPKQGWITFTQWAKQYGGIYSLFLGSQFTVVLSDINLIRAALNKPAFEGRPAKALFKYLFDGKGLGFAEGTFWREQRKFVRSTLHHLVISSCSSEKPESCVTLQEIYCTLVEDIASSNGEPFDPLHALQKASVLVCCDVVFRGVVKPNDPAIDEFIVLSKRQFSINANTGWMTTLPWLRHTPPYRQRYLVMKETAAEGRNLAEKLIARNNALGARENDGKNLIDYTSAFQSKMNQSNCESSFTDDQLYQMAAELVMAGQEDVHGLMYWLVLFMCMYPAVQQKAQDLLDRIVGPSRQPVLTDKANLDYVDAIITESLRFSNFVPFPLPKRVTEDVLFQGFYLPKDTVAITNVYAVHFDDVLWGDPEVFRPERFLNEGGQFKTDHNVIGFGTGRRACPAENFARVQMSMLLSAILLNFSLRFPEGSTPPDIRKDIIAGLVMIPKSYQICATRRRPGELMQVHRVS